MKAVDEKEVENGKYREEVSAKQIEPLKANVVGGANQKWRVDVTFADHRATLSISTTHSVVMNSVCTN